MTTNEDNLAHKNFETEIPGLGKAYIIPHDGTITTGRVLAPTVYIELDGESPVPVCFTYGVAIKHINADDDDAYVDASLEPQLLQRARRACPANIPEVYAVDKQSFNFESLPALNLGSLMEHLNIAPYPRSIKKAVASYAIYKAMQVYAQLDSANVRCPDVYTDNVLITFDLARIYLIDFQFRLMDLERTMSNVETFKEDLFASYPQLLKELGITKNTIETLDQEIIANFGEEALVSFSLNSLPANYIRLIYLSSLFPNLQENQLQQVWKAMYTLIIVEKFN